MCPADQTFCIEENKIILKKKLFLTDIFISIVNTYLVNIPKSISILSSVLDKTFSAHPSSAT